MTQLSRNCLHVFLGAGLLLALAVPASAQITGTGISLPTWNADRNSIAFDDKNDVYLFLEWGSPLRGRFLSKTGATVVSTFAIAESWEGFTGWSGVTFGGTADDPTFLVTYTAGSGGSDYRKYARLVRFRTGSAPSVSARREITFIGHEWYASEKAQAAWYGNRFVVASRVLAGAPWAEPQVHHVDLAGNVTGGQLLGDAQDFYGSPALACATNGVCMVAGYASGFPFGGTGGTYARRFDATTLQPLSAMTYLDDHTAILQEQAIVYVAHADHFLAAWWRGPGHVDTRVIQTSGTMGPLRKEQFGSGFAGDVVLAYNRATETSLVGSKYFVNGWFSAADYGVAELNAEGTPVNLANVVLITPWDLVFPEYFPAIAPNSKDGHWLVSVRQTNGPRVARITGTPKSSTNVPPGPATLVSPSGTVPPASPTFTWNAVAAATGYNLTVDDSSGRRVQGWLTREQTGCAAGTGTCSFTPSITLQSGGASWWVRTRNDYGEGPWSSGMSFTVAAPLGKATLVSPVGETAAASPPFTWHAVTGATHYQLQINDSAGAVKLQRWYTANDLGCSNSATCSVAPGLTLTNGHTDWWVQAWAAGSGYGPWSNGARFKFFTLANILLGVGPQANSGGQFAVRHDASGNFGPADWGQVPWPAYNATGGGIRAASGDLDGDGKSELVIGLGPGSNGWVLILDDASTGFKPLKWIQVPWPAYNAANGEVFPAIGDLDGDGRGEIVLGLGAGGQGWYAVMDDATQNFKLLAWRQIAWPAYTSRTDAEVHPAVGDLDGDGKAEIVLGLGKGSRAWLQVVNGSAQNYSLRTWIQVDWFNYAANPDLGSTFPAVGDLDDDGRAEIVIGLGPRSGGWFQVLDDSTTGFSHLHWGQISWSAYNGHSGETHPAIGNIDGDGRAEIVFGLAAYPGRGGWFEVFDDAAAGFASRGWYNTGNPAAVNGAGLFPAITKR
jgi:hypothetical protein